MKNKLKKTVIFALLLFFPSLIFSQAPPFLGVAEDFVLFTSIGALTNSGATQITGNIGTNDGAFSGFGSINGNVHIEDSVSALCAIDVNNAFNDLLGQTPSVTLGIVIGTGQTLLPNIYLIPSAGSIDGTLNLDGGGNPDAYFLIKIAGALTTTGTPIINLINGTKACNVFWYVQDAATIGANSCFKGTIIAGGAIVFNTGCSLEGRALTVVGAHTVGALKAYTACSSTLPVGPVAPVMDTVECFAILTSLGIVTNTETTIGVDGDIGSNSGSVSGFDPLEVVGLIHPVPDNSTASASSCLSNIYTYLDGLITDIEMICPVLTGNSQVLTPHVYLNNAAAMITDTLFLDAQGVDNAIFVIRIIGSLTTGSSQQVVLVGGAKAENVFWQVDGAVNLGNGTNFIGVIVARGEIILNDGVTLNGRALTTSGAITSVNVDISCSICSLLLPLPIELLSFGASVVGEDVKLNWITTTEINNDYFNIERSENGLDFESIGEIAGSGNSNALINYEFYDDSPVFGTSYYRLKQTDFDGKFEYFNIIAVNFNKDEDGICTLHVYPNPCVGSCVIDLKDCPLDNSQVNVELYDAFGKKIVNRITPKSKDKDISFHLNSSNNLAPGVYIVRSTANGKNESSKIIVK
jgi:hypothetical protein